MADNFYKIFLDSKKPIVKKTLKINEDDYELVTSVFSEHGMAQYLPGLMFKVLADELRSRGIKDVADRLNHIDLLSVPSALANFHIYWKRNFKFSVAQHIVFLEQEEGTNKSNLP